ncbi:hypothetical protein [Burkholderia cenocepacia]|uniref:hypothetical protein n=2 Tax=Burkholderia cenocepacia TaxID=95486 RepID=UPI002011341D|nr:hypothetical protein [Burkholderia cenocepacia]
MGLGGAAECGDRLAADFRAREFRRAGRTIGTMVEPVAACAGVDASVVFQREPISGGDFVMLKPIAVSIITAPAKFSALLANAPEPGVSNSK